MKLLLGLLVSLVFLYFSFKGVQWKGVLPVINSLRYSFLIPALLLIVFGIWIRSLRWGIMLSSLEHISQRKLFPITCIGFMAIALIPMRIGELARPYLVSRESGVSFSPALATIFFERVTDSFCVVVILCYVIFNLPLPEWVIKAGVTFLVFFLVMLFSACLLYFKRDTYGSLISVLMRRLPGRIGAKAEDVVRSFSDGLAIMGSMDKLAYVIFFSLIMWGMMGIGTFCMFGMFNLKLPLVCAFAVLIITAIGVSLPAAPGFIGNFQFACIMGLSLFGVPKNNAFAFSLINYFIMIVMQIGMGLVFMPTLKISFRDLERMGNLKSKGPE